MENFNELKTFELKYKFKIHCLKNQLVKNFLIILMAYFKKLTTFEYKYTKYLILLYHFI